MLLSLSLVGAPAVAARENIGARNAVAHAQSIPHFEIPISAADVIKSLAGAAGSYGAKAAFGWLLSGKPGDAQLEAIRQELAAINQRLTQLQAQVTKIEGMIKESDCEREIGKLDDAKSAVNRIWPLYTALSEPGKYTQGDRTRVEGLIKTLDPGHYLQLIHDKLAVPSPQARSLLAACGQSVQFKAGRFLTPKTSTEMQELLSYWQLYEARLATLEVDVANKDDSPGTAQTTISTARSNLAIENAALKRPIPPETFLDTQKNIACGCEIIWYQRPLASGTWPYRLVNLRTGVLSERDGLTFKLSGASLIYDLFKGCCEGTSAQEWLTKKAGVDWSRVNAINWKQLSTYPRVCHNGLTRSTYLNEEPVIWTSSRLEYPPADLCKPFKDYGVGISIRNRDRAGDLKRWCYHYLQACAYPLTLPGAVFGAAAVHATPYVYN